MSVDLWLRGFLGRDNQAFGLFARIDCGHPAYIVRRWLTATVLITTIAVPISVSVVLVVLLTLGIGNFQHVWLFVGLILGRLCLGFAPGLFLFGCGRNQDPLVVFGVLQKVFRRNPVAGCLSIAGQHQILVYDLLRGSADLAFGTGAVKDPIQVIPTAPAFVTVATAARAVGFLLLSHYTDLF